MTHAILFFTNFVAVFVLVFLVYFPRYRRRDMVVALIGINVGVLVVAIVLSRTSVSMGLGLGLFGVLSIIRLRSSSLGQEEIAYYFAAMTLGLIGGITTGSDWVNMTLMAIIVFILYVSGHPSVFQSARRQLVILDKAIVDEQELYQRLESVLGGSVKKFNVRRIDFVTDTMQVDVCFDAKVGSRRDPLKQIDKP